MNAGLAPILLFLQSGMPEYEMEQPTFRVGVPTSMKPI